MSIFQFVSNVCLPRESVGAGQGLMVDVERCEVERERPESLTAKVERLR
jgi:hypothetical protein